MADSEGGPVEPGALADGMEEHKRDPPVFADDAGQAGAGSAVGDEDGVFAVWLGVAVVGTFDRQGVEGLSAGFGLSFWDLVLPACHLRSPFQRCSAFHWAISSRPCWTAIAILEAQQA